MIQSNLKNYIAELHAHKPLPEGMQEALLGLADAAKAIAKLAATNGLDAPNFGALAGGQNEDGDSQKQLDVLADNLVCEALSAAAVGTYFSEEKAEAEILTPDGRLGVACDPLDGSSNIDTNLTIGTIFSIFAMADCVNGLPPIGRKQLAAGLFVYGPQTALLLSFGDDVAAFALADDGDFKHLEWDVKVPEASPEFAINSSNAAFWPAPIQAYIAERSTGGSAKSSGMRWLGSLVADAFRIFRRGGVFLYPQDSRAGYEQGRLRLIYEASPMAFLIEAAGGLATTGTTAILDVVPASLHQRTPLIFGSKDEIELITTQIANS